MGWGFTEKLRLQELGEELHLVILLHTLLVLLFGHFVLFGVSDSRDLIRKE
jgi:hypothetical protein